MMGFNSTEDKVIGLVISIEQHETWYKPPSICHHMVDHLLQVACDQCHPTEVESGRFWDEEIAPTAVVPHCYSAETRTTRL
jgi:hypothetical protein